MAALKLTKRAIDAFEYEGVTHKKGGKARDVRWDTTVPGFGVRIYPTGKKAFVLNYRAQGRKRFMVLGRYGADLTLDQARDKARGLRVRVREDTDPLEERRKLAQGSTFGDLIQAYVERHAKPHKKTWATDESRLKRHIPPSWRGRKVSAIRRGDVAALHARIGADRPYEANRTLDLLHTMFGLARVWSFIDETGPNPAAGIQKFRERKRKRWVKPEELPPLAEAIDREANIYIRAVLWLYFLTGLRKSELLEARRSDVDWQRGMLRLPDTKAGDEQFATLSGPALAILQSVPEIDGNPHIFPGAKPGRHLVNIDKAWRRVRKKAGVEDVRLHDLRRTVGSWLSQHGADLNLVRDALRHANIATTLTYARLGADPARDAMEEHGKRILEAAGKRRPVEVVNGGGKD